MSSLLKFDLDKKIAVITGGAGLLGKQHALALLECGATVIVTDVNSSALDQVMSELKSIYPKTAISLIMDVADESSIDAAYEQIIAEHGFVNILINNAAIDPKMDASYKMQETSRFENFTKSQWDFQLQVGLTGAFLCSQVFGSNMAVNNGGVILNIASDLSVIAPDQRLYRKAELEEDMQPVKPVTYSVIKTGLIGLTRYLSTYWAHKNIRVNALSPGGVYNNQADEFVKKLSHLIPMGRMAELEEYKSAIQFLCSNASSYMTGQNIIIDGGRSVL